MPDLDKFKNLSLHILIKLVKSPLSPPLEKGDLGGFENMQLCSLLYIVTYLPYFQKVLSRFLYCMASETCSGRMSGLPSRSAMVRESFSTLV